MRFLVVLAVGLALTTKVALAVCNSENGNVPYWSSVNYAAVMFGEVPVCRIGTNVPLPVLEYVEDSWNDAAGKAIMGAGCPSYGIRLEDVNDGDCGWMDDIPNPACAEMPSSSEVVQLLRIWVVHNYVNDTEEGKKHYLAHEVGHTLGFAHMTDTCTSVMSLTCGFFPRPTLEDYANYNEAYFVEAVTNLHGNSNSPANVGLSWDQENTDGERLCNERGFTVAGPVGRYSKVKDTVIALLDDQPYGPQSYSVESDTRALPGPVSQTDVTVDVFGPRLGSLYLFGPAPSMLSDNQGRYLWLIGQVVNPEAVALDVVFGMNVTGKPSGCSQTGLDLPILPGSNSAHLAAHEVSAQPVHARTPAAIDKSFREH